MNTWVFSGSPEQHGKLWALRRTLRPSVIIFMIVTWRWAMWRLLSHICTSEHFLQSWHIISTFSTGNKCKVGTKSTRVTLPRLNVTVRRSRKCVFKFSVYFWASLRHSNISMCTKRTLRSKSESERALGNRVHLNSTEKPQWRRITCKMTRWKCLNIYSMMTTTIKLSMTTALHFQYGWH